MLTNNLSTPSVLHNGYSVAVTIEGIAPILQHAYNPALLDKQNEGAKKKTGKVDYKFEWLETMHVTHIDGHDYICQPAKHIEGTMRRAAVNFTITGKGKKTFKDAILGYCYVSPDDIPHVRDGEWVPAPDKTLLDNPVNGLSVDIRRVVVNRGAIARARLMIDPGWILNFQIDIIDIQLPPDALLNILQEAGRAYGIGDHHPRFGRFQVKAFEVNS